MNTRIAHGNDIHKKTIFFAKRGEKFIQKNLHEKMSWERFFKLHMKQLLTTQRRHFHLTARMQFNKFSITQCILQLSTIDDTNDWPIGQVCTLKHAADTYTSELSDLAYNIDEEQLMNANTRNAQVSTAQPGLLT
jgi:hypothetical protein